MSDNVVNATEQILRDIQTALAGMATKADIAEIKAGIAEIKQTMATKADILGLRRELIAMRAALVTDIRSECELLHTRLDSVERS